MKTNLSFDDLQKIPNILADFNDDAFIQELNNFLKEKYNDYYFYGYKPYNAKYLEITFLQLEKMITVLYKTNRKHPSLFDSINEYYQSAKITDQESVFLFGRTRNE